MQGSASPRQNRALAATWVWFFSDWSSLAKLSWPPCLSRRVVSIGKSCYSLDFLALCLSLLSSP